MMFLRILAAYFQAWRREREGAVEDKRRESWGEH
jgi:hypothetical protein